MEAGGQISFVSLPQFEVATTMTGEHALNRMAMALRVRTGFQCKTRRAKSWPGGRVWTIALGEEDMKCLFVAFESSRCVCAAPRAQHQPSCTLSARCLSTRSDPASLVAHGSTGSSELGAQE